jgi:formylglycine-generating enzyme
MRSRTDVVVVLLVAGCVRELPPAGQVVLYVDTDAIVRPAPDAEPDPSTLSPLVDRARIEVLRDGQLLRGSARVVPIDKAMLQERRLSFGIVPPPGVDGVAVRVRLFRADRVFFDEPEAGITLDTTVAVPPVGRDGIAELSVLLRTEDFGLRVGPVEASPGRHAESLVGTWRGGHRVPCDEDARPGETCVPGTAFFFGNPQFRGRRVTDDISEERLVFVSPFFLDVTEVTVGRFRSQWPSLEGKVAPPTRREESPYCTWTDDTTVEADALALNCVPWDTAFAYCESIGKALPTEAELELVTSGLGEEWGFPWGDDEPDCADAVWGLAGIQEAAIEEVRRGSDHCRHGRGVAAGPLSPGQGQRDKIPSAVLRNLGGGEILDLGGNLAEWSRDVWARPSDEFWRGVRPMVDPLSSVSNDADGDARAVRGGDWASTALTTRGGYRRRARTDERSTTIGFRCARPAQVP